MAKFVKMDVFVYANAFGDPEFFPSGTTLTGDESLEMTLKEMLEGRDAGAMHASGTMQEQSLFSPVRVLQSSGSKLRGAVVWALAMPEVGCADVLVALRGERHGARWGASAGWEWLCGGDWVGQGRGHGVGEIIFLIPWVEGVPKISNEVISHWHHNVVEQRDQGLVHLQGSAHLHYGLCHPLKNPASSVLCCMAQSTGYSM